MTNTKRDLTENINKLSICSLVIDAQHIITRACVDSFQFASNTPFFNSALNKINYNHYLRNASLYFKT